MRKTITISCELVVSAYGDINEILKSIQEESVNCWGVGAGDYSYDIKKIKNLKVIK